MNPIIAVFVPPVNRDNEYAFSQTQQFESFIIDELMPHIDATYRTHTTPDKRAMVGQLFGGLITTQICYNHPGSFGLSAPYSPSYWAKNMEVFNSVLNGPQKDIDWYLDWGTYEYEPSITVDARSMRDGLISKNYDIMWNEWHEGTSWGSWRAHLDIALEYFFPKTVDVSDEKYIPEEYFLSQNFPNPFNPATTIKYLIPEMSKVSLALFNLLGEEVTTLVNEEKSAGNYTVEFNATNLPSGVYFYRLQALPTGRQAGSPSAGSGHSFVETKKMVLMK
jgi:enterochelin esterase family protein